MRGLAARARFKGEGSPLPAPGAARDLDLPAGREADQRLCGLPASLLPDWQEVFLAAFRRALARYRSFRHHLESCLRCGACAAACPFYQGTGDPQNIPAARADLARRVYERFLAPGRRHRPAAELERGLLEQWYLYFHQCSLCRRCALYCPLGIDTAQVTFVCREILAAVGLSSRAASGGAAETYRTGNCQGIMPASWSQRHRGLEEELARETGEPMLCPVDEYGAEVLFIPPAAELARHRAAYKAYAKLFHAAGVSWTVSTYINDAGNAGAWLDYRNLRLIHHRVLEAARELRPKLIMWGESGLGWRVAGRLAPGLGVDWASEDYLEFRRPLSVVEWAYHLYRRGAFQGRLHPEANHRRVVTYHDPCQAARSCGLLQEPRTLLNAVCQWYEMPAGTVGRETLCCGGGGGVYQGAPELALAAMLPRARVLARMQEDYGCNWVATICDGCKSALGRGLRRYGLGMSVGGVVELLGQALYPTGLGQEAA